MASQITQLPTPPQRTDDQQTFTTRADALMAALQTFVTQTNTVATEAEADANTANTKAGEAAASAAAALASQNAAAASASAAGNSAGTQATSTTSMTIGTGSKSFTLAQTGKAFVVNQFVIIVNNTTNWMAGFITAFNSGSGAITVDVTTTSGSGTLASWTVTPSAPISEVPFSAVEVLNISADTSLTSTSKNVVRVTSTVRASSVKLPAGTALAAKNGVYMIKNVGSFALPVRDQDGNLLSVLPNGSTGIYTLEDGSTTAGVWGVVASESYPAIAYTAAAVEALTVTWVGASNIPGVANKALIAWATTSGSLKVAIATRNASTGAVTVGTPLTVTSSLTSTNNAMVKALTSTTALCAGTVTQSVVFSLTLNTSTDTVTTTGNQAFGAAVGGSYKPENVIQLDSTRVAWLFLDNGANILLNIATYGATPTASQNSLASANINHTTSAIVHVGSGNIAGIASTGAAILTTSGNSSAVASTSTGYNNIMATNSRAVGFAPLSANRATFAISGNAADDRDFAMTITPSGTTLPVGPNAVQSFKSAPMQTATETLKNFIAGSSYCTFSMSTSSGPAPYLRVMRYTDAQLLETVAGGIEGLPISNNTYIAFASMGGQACIAIGQNRSNFPQVFSMEVIKA